MIFGDLYFHELTINGKKVEDDIATDDGGDNDEGATQDNTGETESEDVENADTDTDNKDENTENEDEEASETDTETDEFKVEDDETEEPTDDEQQDTDNETDDEFEVDSDESEEPSDNEPDTEDEFTTDDNTDSSPEEGDVSDEGELDTDNNVDDATNSAIELEKSLYDNLNPAQQKMRSIELKSLFAELYTKVDETFEKINTINSPTVEISETISRLMNTLNSLKMYIEDYISDVFENSSYTENMIIYQKYLVIFNSVGKVLKEVLKSIKKHSEDDDN